MKLRGGRVSPSARRALIILPFWLASNIWLWSWLLNPGHISNVWFYIPLICALFYEIVVMPGAFIFFITKARSPAKRRAMQGSKVALITPCVPAQESLHIIEKQLAAMNAVTYPHDSWILDEGNSKAIQKLARKYNVKYFTRKGKKKYNQPNYPFMAKTKAGNVNAWLDFVKRRNYEFFVQLDIDHLPNPNYLDKTLGHFRDPKIGYVQAPSVYGNLEYWTSRSSAEQELGVQGPLQMGFYGNAGSPVIIGSHTSFRMSAIREIGGFQATRAEDHLNTLAMMSHGWNGVFVPEVIAVGDGPETLDAYLSQQYAWARSMSQILFSHSWQHLKKISLRQKIQYAFMQTWYPASALTYLMLFITPIIALITGALPIEMSPGDYLMRFPLAMIATWSGYWAGRPLMQPQNVHLSWRGTLLHLVRWPIILLAICGVLMGRKKPYQITPKGKFTKVLPSVRLYRPFLILSTLSAIAILFSTLAYGHAAPTGQIIFAMLNLITMLSITLIDLNVRLRDSRKTSHTSLHWLRPITTVSAATVLAGLAIVLPFSPNQTTLAISTAPSSQSISSSLDSRPAQLLTDSELNQEIASTKYRYTDLTLPGLGLYYPKHAVNSGKPYVRHTFIDWRENRKLAEQLLISERLHTTPLLTIDPKGELDGVALLRGIANGKYDSVLEKDLGTIALSPNPVYIRFAHEMDLPDIYPWGNQDPEVFIAAYRHVVDLAKSRHVTNIKWVWSPAGTASAAAYYPGDQYADIVGTTILYDSYWSQDYHPNFSDLQESRAWLRTYNKPVWITEFGIGNEDPAFQAELIKEALSEYKSDGYQVLVYINTPDTNIVGPDYRLKDLSALGSTFTRLPARTPAHSSWQPTKASSMPVASPEQLPKPFLPKPLQFHIVNP